MGKTEHSRRNFLTSAAGIAAGGTVMVLTAVPASAVSLTADPVFAAIEAHAEARSTLRKAEAAHALAEREMKESGELFPRVVSIGNPYSGLPRPVSISHADIDRFTPADLYPQDNKREHEEMSAAILRCDTRMNPLQDVMNEAWDAESEALEDLVATVPTTIDGVLAMLKFHREYAVGPHEFMDAELAASLAESVEEGLLNLKSEA